MTNKKEVAHEVATPELETAETPETVQKKAMVLRLYFGNVHKDEVFLMPEDNKVPPQINEFVGAFKQGLDAVWTPNPTNQRAYRVRNITAYEVQPITLNIQQPPSKTEDAPTKEDQKQA